LLRAEEYEPPSDMLATARLPDASRATNCTPAITPAVDDDREERGKRRGRRERERRGERGERERDRQTERERERERVVQSVLDHGCHVSLTHTRNTNSSLHAL
jgi:hypothetical protein